MDCEGSPPPRGALSAVLALVLLGACATSAFQGARREDNSQAWRRFLAEHPSAPEASAARARLVQLEFEAARHSHTVLAYRRFLAEFPDAPRRADAQALLEALRFETASRAGTLEAWADFLRDHPDGTRANEARAAYEEQDLGLARGAGTSRAVEEFLARHPDSKHRAGVEVMLDDRRFAEARAAGPRALATYLEKSDAGAHRDEARAELSAREAAGLALLGDFEGARRAAQGPSDEALRSRVLARIDELELERVAASLEPRALRAFAARGGPAALEAKRLLSALEADAAGGRALRALVQRLDPTRFARPEAEVLRALAAPDPRDRWLAARELGRTGSPHRTLGDLLDAAADSRFSRVRVEAFEALGKLFAPLPGDFLDVEVRRRMEGLRRKAQGAGLFVRLAILEELTGAQAEAVDDYRRALSAPRGDQFVLWRLAEIWVGKGDGPRAAAAARSLALAALELVEQRGRDEGLSPLLFARTLCGARDDARAAARLLEALPAKAALDFPEDLAVFRERARRAVLLASARLSDAESAAKTADPGFEGCDDDDGAAGRLDEGEADRVRAIGELAGRRDPRAAPAIALSARLDPSSKVREAALAALETRGGRR